MKRYYFIIGLMGLFVFANGQAGMYSEDEVQTERKFVDAKSLALLEKNDEAISTFLSFLKETPHNAAAANEISKIYALQHDKIQAIEWAKKSVKWNKDNEWYVINLIELYQDSDEYEAAALLFEPLIKKAPHKKYNYEKQGYLYVLAQMPEKAIKSYDLYIQNIGEDRNILLKKIALLGGTGEDELAFNLLNKLTLDYPDDERVLLKMGRYLMNHDRENEAKIYFEKVLLINPQNNQAHRLLNKDIDVSSISLDELINNENVDIDIKINKLYPYLKELVEGNKIDNHILDLVQQLTIIHATDAKSYALAGDFSMHRGYLQKALEYYDQSLEINKTIFEVWLQKMDILKLQGEFKTLEKFSSQCVELYPYKAQAFLNLAIAQIENGDYSQALSNLQPALLMSRKSPMIQSNIYLEMARVYLAENKVEKAIATFDIAIEKDNKNDRAFKVFSYSLLNLNKNKDKTIKLAQTAMSLQPLNPDNRLNYAYILYRFDDFKTAKEVLDVLIMNDETNNCSIHEPYGDILYQLGDTVKAMTHWQKANKNCPGNKRLEKKISQKKL